MIHGLSPAKDTQAHSLRPDYPVCRDRIIRSVAEAGLSGPDFWKSPGPMPSVARGGRQGGRIIRAGLLRKSGPGTESCARAVFEGPDNPVLSGRIIRPEVSATSISSASPPPLPCLVQLEGPCSEGFVGSYLMTQSMSVGSSIPSKVEPRSKVERSEFTLSCNALTRDRVIGPLGGLGGVGVESMVVSAASSPPPLENETSSSRRCLHLHGMVRGRTH